MNDVGNPRFSHHLDGFDQAQLQVQFAIARPLHPPLGVGKNVHHRQQAIGFAVFRRIEKFFPQLLRNPFVRCLRIHFRHDQGTQRADEFVEQLRNIPTRRCLALDDLQRRSSVFLENRLTHRRNGLARSEPEDVEHIGFLNLIATKRYELIEHRLRITHAAVSPFGNRPCRRLIQGNAFLLGNVRQMLGNRFRRNRSQIETLTTRKNGRQNLVHLCGRKDEFHMRRRLFQGLQQGIEGLIGQHVHLVDVVNFEFPLHRRVVDGVAQRTHFVDTVVGSTVDLDNIERCSFGNLQANWVVRIEVDLGPARTIQCFRKNPRRRGLARATRADKKIGMRQTILLNRIAQGSDHMILPQDIVKCRRTIFSRKNLIAHACILAHPGHPTTPKNRSSCLSMAHSEQDKRRTLCYISCR